MQGETIIHEHAYMSKLLWHFKDILFKMAGAEVSGIVEDIPFVPAVVRYLFGILNFGAVRNSAPTLPTGRLLLLIRYEHTAVKGRDRNVFSEHNFRADLQEVELLVGNKPF